MCNENEKKKWRTKREKTAEKTIMTIHEIQCFRENKRFCSLQQMYIYACVCVCVLVWMRVKFQMVRSIVPFIDFKSKAEKSHFMWKIKLAHIDWRWCVDVCMSEHCALAHGMRRFLDEKESVLRGGDGGGGYMVLHSEWATLASLTTTKN